MHKLLREPLLHFLLIGAVLFGLYGLLNGGLGNSANEIVVSRGQMQNLQAQFERVWQRPPTAQELQGLIDSWVREEIFYREGQVMGLDRDDPVVRRRIAQKVEFIVDGIAPAAPTAQELQAWLDAHPASYAIEPSYSLHQIFFDPSRHGDRLQADIAAAQRALQRGKRVSGDATMLPATLDRTRKFEVIRAFGSDFTDALKTLPVGSWQGPISSAFGVHLVQLTSREDERKATLEEVRVAVERDLLHERSQEASDAYYKRLRSNYNVRIDAGADVATGPTG